MTLTILIGWLLLGGAVITSFTVSLAQMDVLRKQDERIRFLEQSDRAKSAIIQNLVSGVDMLFASYFRERSSNREDDSEIIQ